MFCVPVPGRSGRPTSRRNSRGWQTEGWFAEGSTKKKRLYVVYVAYAVYAMYVGHVAYAVYVAYVAYTVYTVYDICVVYAYTIVFSLKLKIGSL